MLNPIKAVSSQSKAVSSHLPHGDSGPQAAATLSAALPGSVESFAPRQGSVNTQRMIYGGFPWPGLRSGVHQFHAHSSGQHPVMSTPNAKAAEDYTLVVCR